jgi:hypothetical protein
VRSTVLARRAIAVSLVAAAALFVVGVRAEGDEGDHTDEPTSEASESSEQQEGTEVGGEADEHDEAEAAAEDDAGDEGETEERVLGLDLESPLLVGTAVVVSLLLAGLTWARRDRGLLLTVGVFAWAFALLDAAEVVHQLDEDNAALAALAAVIAALHAGVAVLALQQAAASTPANPEHEPSPT